MPMIIAIAAGGALGAVLRHYLNTGIGYLTAASYFPFGIMTANILGSFMMGVLIALFAHIWDPPLAAKAFLTVGLLGAFTTFSTFSLDAVMLIQRGALAQAAVYMIGSVVLGVGGLILGMAAVRLFAV